MRKQAEVAAVLPTCRGYKIPKQSIPVNWIIVHDRQRQEVDDGNMHRGYNPPYHLIPSEELYGAGTSAIRQAGLDWAYDQGFRYVLTVDDDCVLPVDWAEQHVQALRGTVPVCNNTVPGQEIRGLTNDHSLPVGISHGLWSGVLDYPAWYQLAAKPGPVELEDKGWSKISAPFPMCGMNVGFRRELLPATYFQHQFLRHDDIFAGWIVQKIASIFGYGFVNGGAIVKHERASNAEVNYQKELPGDEINKALLEKVMAFDKPLATPALTMLGMAYHLRLLAFKDNYVNRTYHAMIRDLFKWINTRRGELS